VGFKRNFDGFKRSTKLLLVGSFVLGLALFASFTLTDLGVNVTLGAWDPKPHWLKQFNADWFHDHAYLPNIYAAITGFLIGAPIALTVLATFAVQREEQAGLDRVNRLSVLAWRSFYIAISDFATPERLTAVQTDAKTVETSHNWAYELLADYIAHLGPQGAGDAALTDKIEAIGRLAPKFRAESHDILAKVKDSGTVELEWAKVVGAWDTLNQYVRLQRLEQGLEWFDAESDARLRMWMARSKNPLQAFTDIHGFNHDAERSTLTMQDAAEETYIYAGLPASEFQGLLGLGLIRFGTKRVPIHDYNTAYKEAANFLEALQGAVSMVEAANWPECQSRPVDPGKHVFPQSTLRKIGSQPTREGQAAVIRELEQSRSEQDSGTPD